MVRTARNSPPNAFCPTYPFRTAGNVFYSRRIAWIAIAIIIAVILPIIMCIVCAVYCYRKKALQEDPDWKMSLPRSRSGSRANLRNLNDADGDSTRKVYRTHEPLEGKPDVEFPEKKWDLDEEDFTSSDGSEFPASKQASEIEYLNRSDPQRQTGRRSARISSDGQTTAIEEEGSEQDDDESELPPPPPVAGASSAYSPTYSGLDRNSSGFSATPSNQFAFRQPANNAVRVLPNATQDPRFFGEGSLSPISARSPVPGQNVGLPAPVVNAKSTEV